MFLYSIFFDGEKKVKHNPASDSGELSQAVIIIAGLSIAAIVAIGGISAVLIMKGEATAQCIKDTIVGVFKGEPSKNCMNDSASRNDERRTFNWKLVNQYANVTSYSIGISNMGYTGIAGNDLFAHYTKVDYLVNKHLKAYPIPEADTSSVEDMKRYNQQLEEINKHYLADHPELKEFYDVTGQAMRDCEDRLGGVATRMVNVHERGEEMNLDNYYVSCDVPRNN